MNNSGKITKVESLLTDRNPLHDQFLQVPDHLTAKPPNTPPGSRETKERFCFRENL